MQAQALRHCAEWLVVPTEQIVVERFFGWRRAGKRRLFQPCAVLRAGAHQILVDGLDAVWELIDAIQPEMPRRIVNEGMKGGFVLEGEQPFAHDLQAFLRESATSFLIFSCDFVREREPNSTSIFAGLKMRSVVAPTAPVLRTATPAAWGSVWAVRLPYRGQNREVLAPALIVGDYPRIVVVMNLADSDVFTFSAPCLVSSIVCSDGEGLDIRPHATQKREEPRTIIDDVERRLHDMHETDWTPEPFHGDERTHGGMTFKERDMIERQRAIQVFCDLDTRFHAHGLLFFQHV